MTHSRQPELGISRKFSTHYRWQQDELRRYRLGQQQQKRTAPGTEVARRNLNPCLEFI